MNTRTGVRLVQTRRKSGSISGEDEKGIVSVMNPVMSRKKTKVDYTETSCLTKFLNPGTTIKK